MNFILLLRYYHFIDDPLEIVNADIDFSNLGLKPVGYDCKE